MERQAIYKKLRNTIHGHLEEICSMEELGDQTSEEMQRFTAKLFDKNRKFMENFDSIIENLISIADKQDQQYKELEEKMGQRYEQQDKVIDGLGKQVKNLKDDWKREQVYQVSRNIIVKTTKDKDSNEAKGFVLSCMRSGTDDEVNDSDLMVSSIPAKKEQSRKFNLYRVSLRESNLKGALFKGISNQSDSAFSVSHETPKFLMKKKFKLDQVQFTLRKTHAKNLKAKIVLKSLDLKMVFWNDGAWVDADKIVGFLDIELMFSAKDKKPEIIPTCRQVLVNLQN